MPTRPILRSYWIFYFSLIGFFPLIVTLAVLGTLMFQGEITSEEATVPLIGIGFMSFSIFCFVGLIGTIAILWERSRIGRVYRDTWGMFAQFSSDQQWRDYAELEQTRSIIANPIPKRTVLLITLLIIGIMVYISMMVFDLTAIVALIVTYGIIIALIIGYPLINRLSARRRYRRQIAQPIPNIYINKNGIYDEATGYQAFEDLIKVEFIAPAKVKSYYQSLQMDLHLDPSYPPTPMIQAVPYIDDDWAVLVFISRIHAQHANYKRTLIVRVPPDKVEIAPALVARFQTPKQKRKQKA